MTDTERNPFEPLLSAASLAPSGDNTQPWGFLVDPDAGRIMLRLDPSRDPSPMNAGQRMARIAVGAALENLLRAAASCGWEVTPEPVSPPDLAAIRLVRRGGAAEVPAPILGRLTNRRPYEVRPVPAEVLAGLVEETPPLEGVSTHWIVERERLVAAGGIIGRADAVMFGDPSMRLAFLAKVRFDAPADARVEEGLSLGSLELSAPDRLALRLMRRMPDWALRLGGAGRVFEAKARRLIEGASGFCLVVAPDGAESTDLIVGRAMQRAWLALAGRGLSAQPMMSLFVLENALDHGAPALVAALGAERVAALSREFRALMTEVGAGRPAFLLRFGFAEAPSGRTGRLPLHKVVSPAGPPAEGG